MTKNQSNRERLFRIAMGLGLIGIAFMGPKTPIGFIGILPLMTGLMGWCPIYRIFGFSTCPIHDKK